MSTTITRLKWFDITQHEEEQEYLREMHKQGWRLVSVKLFVYRFEACTPEDVVYQLDYHKSMEDREEYLQLFRDCGWEYIQDMMGYSYFRKPAADMAEAEEGIFCDGESRLGMWDRVFRGRVTTLIIIFLCIIIPQLLAQHTVNTGLFAVYVVLFVLYVWLLVRFAWKYRQAKARCEEERR